MTGSSSASNRLVWLLAAVTLVGYGLRTNITIAQEHMAPDLGLTMADMGIISAWGFQFVYAVFQLPGGFLGDRYGARLIMGLSIIGWSLANLLSGLTVSTAGLAFLSLFATRVLLGMTQAPTFPVAALAVTRSVPANRRVSAVSIYIASSMLGAALAPLTLAPLMVAMGWRAVFIASSVVGLAMAVAWFALAPNDAPTATERPARLLGLQMRESLALLRDRNLLVLSASYFLHSAVHFVFVFWFFRYLTEGRGFSVLASGGWGSLPNLMAFAVAPVLGVAIDRWSRRIDAPVARQRAAMASLITSAVLVTIGANLPSATLAILALGASVALISSTESPFWTTAAAIGRDNPGSAGGVLNLMGNLGGVVSIWLVPPMKDAWGWTAMLGFWAAMQVTAALLWLLVRPPAPALSAPNASRP
ncbi:MAG: MFS transporter [Gemmatimonadetes bacterium]|nr:MFS transporter [Gemmatimonadota bacterium]